MSAAAVRFSEREERRVRFGIGLSEALRSRRLSQQDLAKKMGTTQSAVSAWITGKSVPAADDVFAIEMHLGMTPGVLSSHLGYQPVDADLEPPDMENAITRNPHLDTKAKTMMTDFYRTLRTLCEEKATLAAVASNGSVTRRQKAR